MKENAELRELLNSPETIGRQIRYLFFGAIFHGKVVEVSFQENGMVKIKFGWVAYYVGDAELIAQSDENDWRLMDDPHPLHFREAESEITNHLDGYIEIRVPKSVTIKVFPNEENNLDPKEIRS